MSIADAIACLNWDMGMADADDPERIAWYVVRAEVERLTAELDHLRGPGIVLNLPANATGVTVTWTELPQPAANGDVDAPP